MKLTFENFRHYNAKRCRESYGEKPGNYPVELWALGLVGEAGELAQEIKRLRDCERRLRRAVKYKFKGSDQGAEFLYRQKLRILENIKCEIGDILPYVDMIAASFGLTLEECVVSKFNEVSDRIGSPVKIPN